MQPNEGFNWNHRIAERNPTNGVLLNVMKEEGLQCRVAEAQSVRLLGQFIDDGFPHADGSELCVFGHPKPPQEVGKFTHFARSMKLFAIVMITPSEVIHVVSATPSFWAQVLWIDSTVFGGVVGRIMEYCYPM